VQAEENINSAVGRRHTLLPKRKKSLKYSSSSRKTHVLMRIPYGNKAKQRTNLPNDCFCGKPSLFPDASSSANFSCNSSPLTKVFGSLQAWVYPAAGLFGCCLPAGKECQDHLIFALPLLLEAALVVL